MLTMTSSGIIDITCIIIDDHRCSTPHKLLAYDSYFLDGLVHFDVKYTIVRLKCFCVFAKLSRDLDKFIVLFTLLGSGW